MKQFRIAINGVSISALVAFCCSTAMAQPTSDLLAGVLVQSNVIEVNDTLDPNNPDVSGQDPANPPQPSFVLRNYGASGPDVTNSPGWVNLAMESDGTFIMQNIQKAIQRFAFDAAFTRQVFMVATPTAGEIELTGEPMMTFNGAQVGDACCNSVGIGGYGFADLHIFDMNSDDPANIQTPQIALQAFSDFWQIGTYADSSAPGYAGLSFFYDDFDTVEGGQAPVQFLPAPQDTLIVASSDGTLSGTSRVGIGGYASAALHVMGDSDNENDAQVRVENANTANPGKARKLFVIKNDGPAKFSMFASDSDEWAFNGRASEFRISKQGTGKVEMELSDTGNLSITGTLTQGSSRTIKQDIEEVDVDSVLEKVVSLPISEWSYTADGNGVRHLGPMAEDFYASFELGHTDKGLTSVDTSGVALAAIKGLYRDLERKNALIQEQGERLQQLELMLGEFMSQSTAQFRVSKN